MRLSTFTSLFAALFIGELSAQDDCHEDNCLRAIQASAFPTVHGTADCSSIMVVTVSASTTILPTAIPAYASPCTDFPEYSSACSCIGITETTTIITPTCSVGQASCNGGACQDILSDPNNCGTCGNVCGSGSTCSNGECSAPTCAGSTCDDLGSCQGDCFCFETADGTGFCGPSESCAPLTDCESTDDCDAGFVCATGTCCGRNVCLNACDTPLPGKRDVQYRSGSVNASEMEMWTDGPAPVGFF